MHDELGLCEVAKRSDIPAGSNYYVFALYYLLPIWQSHSCTQLTLLDKKSNYYRPAARSHDGNK